MVNANTRQPSLLPRHNPVYRLCPMAWNSSEATLPVMMVFPQRLFQTRGEAVGEAPAGPDVVRNGRDDLLQVLFVVWAQANPFSDSGAGVAAVEDSEDVASDIDNSVRNVRPVHPLAVTTGVARQQRNY